MARRALALCVRAWAQIESPIPQDDAAGNAALRSKFTKPIAMHFGNPPHATVVREQCADGYVVGGKLPRYRWYLRCILAIWVAFFSRWQR